MIGLIRISTVLIFFLNALPYQLHGQDAGPRDTGFKITLSRRAEFPPGFDAELVTTSYYPCEGYRMRPTVSWDKDTISIDIGGFVRPSPCFKTMSQATGTAYLRDIGDGRYLLRIRYRGDENLYRLRVAHGAIRFEPVIATFTELISK